MMDVHTLSAEWLDEGGFFVWGFDQTGYPVDSFTLKSDLFSWDADSYFGTLIETIQLHRKEGLFLAPDTALRIFADPRPLQHRTIKWSEQTDLLLNTAGQLKNRLSEGLFQPDFTKWQSGHYGWKLLSPISDPPVYLDRWLDGILSALTEKNEALQAVWAQVTQAYPLIHSEGGMYTDWTEEEWLIAIGWKHDDVPFSTCLRIDETADGESWMVSLMLQDRENKENLFAWPEDDISIAPPCPESWLLYQDRMDAAIQKIMKILPLAGQMLDETAHYALTNEEAWWFLTEGSTRLVEAGFPVFLPSWWEQIKQRKPRLKANIRSSVGSGRQSLFGIQQLMEFDWQLAVGDVTLSEDEVSQIIDQQKHLIRIHGEWIQLDAAMLAQIQAIMKRVRKNKGLTLSDVLRNRLVEPEEDVENELRLEIELNKPLRKMLMQLQQTSEIPLISAPDTLEGQLRPYQAAGVSWLLFLRRFGLGACLADDMGLGKTIQFISYLLHSKEAKDGKSPSLLVCPTSVLGNWQKELERFAPSLQVYVHYGPSRKRGDAFVEAIKEADIVLTSYTLSHLDEEEMQSIMWDAICLDEAQNIKNAYTKQSTAIRMLRGQHRIALTGTPVENRLTELWSIFDFINPGYLGSLHEFTHSYVSPIERTQEPGLIEQVQRLIRPFLLRRVKNDPKIQLELPNKYETKEFVSLTVEQASLYENMIQNMFERIDHSSPMERRGLILTALTRLKQVCNHPALALKEDWESNWKHRSHKIERLLDMVSEVRQEGNRCLIFTQFVQTGRMLKSVLEDELKQPVYFLHGGVPKNQRDEMISRFQSKEESNEEPCGIFILSLKAGGTGLNLTAANHVFHFDRWWNPAVENQATDRSHRIGQTQPVQVHKFVTLGTLEERIDEMIERKRSLSEQIIGTGESWITEMSTEDLRELFALRREWVET
ncbi:DEAD/DEAH box helicase [Aneurinibacillus sp. Ricciae_BoGa-3]|uniref:DEAD/DEAH box helicase n=1 Tax=Aneurinibacillus sp. Ricciae_BoGa-3 TaxID=3022697 RepID=UPI002341515A|nr:DEAD/DEAH box helicase [Aneurinibacillus sp. Ricciae_BoGa-3]WCK55261.1 DEAD/DEAH box helicase [Aneurinibacillus sp. Ricciae_BoGa-3]